MRHYPHHIGDFNSATRHLTRVERSLYRDLIDLYYDTEQPLNGDFDLLARRVICHEEDKPALRSVLNEFFSQEDDGWHNARCDAEIAKYQGQIDQASRAGKASAAKRLNTNPTPVERPLDSRCTNQNQEPEPLTNKQPSVVKRATRIPENFEPKTETEAEAGIDRAKELANFRDYWLAKAGKDACKLDWQATWRQWARRADRPGVSRFNKPGPSMTIPSKPGRDPELTRLDIERSRAAPMPAAIREQMQKLKFGVPA